jgi:enamine deaminase RidA (YjgF/YER057c/UK114 family)
MSAEARLAELGIELPSAPRPVANYVPAVQVGELLFLSGHGPFLSDGTRVSGKLGAEVDVERGREAARLTGLNLLATLRTELGSLDRVAGIVKVLGLVASAPGFGEQPAVLNGCSDLLVEVLGDVGKHARSAVGVAELPMGMCVEIELIARVAD